MTYKLNKNGLIRLEDKALIPVNTDNFDYIQYLKWVSEGNIPEPEFTQEEIATNIIAEDNLVAKTKLLNSDNVSIRLIREFLIAKFKADKDMPQQLLDIEAAAILERTKIK